MDKKYTVLIVDDNEYNRSLLADILSEEYNILEASDGMEALAILGKLHAEIHLILLDIVMPKMDGFEVLAFLNKSGWIEEIPVITISAETSSSYIDHAYDLGAIEFISRPFDVKTVKRRVKNTIILYAKQKMLEGMVTEQILEKEKNNLLMVEILSNIVEFRNGESGLHVLHIRVITELLLRVLQHVTDRYPLTAAEISLIVNASALHDIGKISVDEAILNKPGRLTPDEFEIIKTHSATGERILRNAPLRQREELVRVVADICRWHHERYDGGGYPDGLKGEEIPIAAQVVALADVYDALVSKRVYKRAYAHEKAMEMIANGECGVFNPVLLECLRRIGDTLAEELKVRSLNGVSKAEVQHVAGELLQGKSVSNRTLALLEQERTKYRFFASMSKEIQFEYSYKTDMLSMSEWGAQQLGIEEIVPFPENNATLRRVFPTECYADLKARLRAATPLDPIVSTGYYLIVGGKKRWYKAVARPLWADEEGREATGVIGKFSDVHEEHQQIKRLKVKAELDSLTELYHHGFMRKYAEKACAKNKCGALLFLDVDSFKSVNDTRGHLAGDRVLRAIAAGIRKYLGGEGIAARVGGDEFVILLRADTDVRAAADRIFRGVTDGCDFPVTVSAGLSLCPSDGAHYEEQLRRADSALYRAKKDGGNRLVLYDDSLRNTLSALSPIDCGGERGD